VAPTLRTESRARADQPETGREVVVVSKDMPLRILAETLGLRGEEYRNEMVVVDRAYTGMEEANVTEQVVNDLYDRGTLDEFTTDLARIKTASATGDGSGSGLLDLPANTGVRLLSPRGSALAIVRPGGSLQRLTERADVFGVRGRSAEQKIALDHLLNPDIGIVSLGGRAGTGKTYTALAAGLEQTLEQSRYKKVIVFRPLFAVGGQELGFLPGSAEEKMSPWGAAVFDALATMTTKDVVEELLARDMLEVLPLTHLRGRSLTDAFVIVDEAQNLERPVLLTALTRLGENTKVALSWDAAQRDNTRVGRYDGIAAIVERLKGQPLFAHVTFTRSERGPIADLATRLLDDLV
jgi:PhoH-like ATPase